MPTQTGFGDPCALLAWLYWEQTSSQLSNPLQAKEPAGVVKLPPAQGLRDRSLP